MNLLALDKEILIRQEDKIKPKFCYFRSSFNPEKNDLHDDPRLWGRSTEEHEYPKTHPRLCQM